MVFDKCEEDSTVVCSLFDNKIRNPRDDLIEPLQEKELYFAKREAGRDTCLSEPRGVDDHGERNACKQACNGDRKDPRNDQ